MSLISMIKNTGKLLGVKMERSVPSLGNALGKYDIPKGDYSFTGNQVQFAKLGISIDKDKAMPLYEGYHNALRLLKRPGTVFSTAADGNLCIKVDGVQYRINDQEEIFILGEVFLEGSYNLVSPTSKKIAIIDIGMNVGITSLFYAAQSRVEKIFSFEPFTPTFNMALTNIGLNGALGAKITPHNFGLAKAKGQLQLSYSTKQKGRMGLSGVPAESSYITEKDVQLQSIALEPVNEQFAAIQEKVKDNFVICKMDCEGAEYELFEALFESGLISLPDVYLIEWHEKGTKDIVNKLISHNYNVLDTSFHSLTTGMVYAMRNC